MNTYYYMYVYINIGMQVYVHVSMYVNNDDTKEQKMD